MQIETGSAAMNVAVAIIHSSRNVESNSMNYTGPALLFRAFNLPSKMLNGDYWPL